MDFWNTFGPLNVTPGWRVEVRVLQMEDEPNEV